MLAKQTVSAKIMNVYCCCLQFTIAYYWPSIYVPHSLFGLAFLYMFIDVTATCTVQFHEHDHWALSYRP